MVIVRGFRGFFRGVMEQIVGFNGVPGMFKGALRVIRRVLRVLLGVQRAPEDFRRLSERL